MVDTSVPSRVTQLPMGDEELRYSTSEIQEYFQRIKLPRQYLDSPVLCDAALAQTKQHGLALLHAITRYHACNVPFENLELHYSARKVITLQMADLYAKIVTQRRGGRCMEGNTFFATVLRSLGVRRVTFGPLWQKWLGEVSADALAAWSGTDRSA